jgi:DNA polymerase II large subunit
MEIKKYFDHIVNEVKVAYDVADLARKQGYDPESQVEIPLAKNMAERVEGLVGALVPGIKNSGLSTRIQELELEYGKLNWKVALKVSLEVAQEKFCSFDNKIKAMESGIRVGLAYLTSGVVSSPLEGFVELKIKKRRDGKDYFCLMYSGPIRSAGGTAGAVSVILADFIRIKSGYHEYDATEEECKRMATELYDYHERITNLQYLPSEKEILNLVKNLPVQVDGDPSEIVEVSNYKDLARIETNKIRSGACLVLGECIAQKAVKVWNNISLWADDFGIGHWKFLEEFISVQKKAKSKDQKSGSKISPIFTYIEDLVAGRPVLTHPLAAGGFRLRYGRCRVSGYSSTSIHPATMHILKKYLATGTQLKIERPGKATAITVCDNIDGPIVKLKDDSVIRIEDETSAKHYATDIKEILFLGDILISYGDFYNRGHNLVPPGYCEEWWTAELEDAAHRKFGPLNPTELSKLMNISEKTLIQILNNPVEHVISSEDAFSITRALNIPLHPRYTYHWKAISGSEVKGMLATLRKAKTTLEGDKILKLVIPYDFSIKRQFDILGVPHKVVNNEFMVVENGDAVTLSNLFKLTSLNNVQLFSAAINNSEKHDVDINGGEKKPTSSENGVESKPVISTPSENIPLEMDGLGYINKISKIIVRDKSGVFIGARMGRPEKAKMRKLTGNPHTLFPIGEEGGRLRSFQGTFESKKITAEFPQYFCETCQIKTIFGKCEKCGNKTDKMFFCQHCGPLREEKCRHGKAQTFHKQTIDIKYYFDTYLKKLNMKTYPDLIKGVRGTSNKDHIPEHFVKGIFRAMYDICVNKEGTTRYDMTQLPITHFKPKEINTSVEKLIKLGYDSDVLGVNLENDNQVLELFPQDIILPACPDSPELGADKILMKVASFIDDMLEFFYKQDRFYKFESEKDIPGTLVAVLAPHTAAAITGRIIGFSKTQGFFASPLLHAATRRDCDGDEASITLLLDALLNFSKQFLPDKRGSTQDAPLVLTSTITPSEVDDMAFDLDVVWKYPLEFYNACNDFKQPREVKIKQFGSLLDTEAQFRGLGYTHSVSDINMGVVCSAYKVIPTMEDKLKGQMELADIIRAVDASDVARLVIEKHLIRDIRGNLRKFSMQQFRCSTCNEKYRRPPLVGKCIKCSGKIIFTISEGSIVKYLEPAISLADKYNLPSYLKQNLELTKRGVESIFGKDKEKQIGLGKWFQK